MNNTTRKCPLCDVIDPQSEADHAYPCNPAPQGGYTNCACRDCMDTAVSGDVSEPELCGECKRAECVPWPGEIELNEYENYECQREDAYSGS